MLVLSSTLKTYKSGTDDEKYLRGRPNFPGGELEESWRHISYCPPGLARYNQAKMAGPQIEAI